mgnify:CR=1 FL=1
MISTEVNQKRIKLVFAASNTLHTALQTEISHSFGEKNKLDVQHHDEVNVQNNLLWDFVKYILKNAALNTYKITLYRCMVWRLI